MRTPKNRVIVDVIGGVANVWRVPDGIEVEVRDYDNGEASPRSETHRDKNGDRYCRAIYASGDGS